MLASAHSLGAGALAPEIGRLAGAFRAATAEGHMLRETYSHAVVVIDNVLREQMEFPDSASLQLAKLESDLADVKARSATADAAAQAAADAADQARATARAAKAAANEVREIEDAIARVRQSAPAKGGDVER